MCLGVCAGRSELLANYEGVRITDSEDSGTCEAESSSRGRTRVFIGNLQSILSAELTESRDSAGGRPPRGGEFAAPRGGMVDALCRLAQLASMRGVQLLCLLLAALWAGCSAHRPAPIAPSPPAETHAPGELVTASWYGPGFNGRRTASGETFDQHGLSAAHPSLPLGSRVRVTNPANGRSVVLRINDRGPFTRGRGLDLSYGAAKRLQLLERGTGRVRIEVLDRSGTVTASPASPPRRVRRRRRSSTRRARVAARASADAGVGEE